MHSSEISLSGLHDAIRYRISYSTYTNSTEDANSCVPSNRAGDSTQPFSVLSVDKKNMFFAWQTGARQNNA